jgi:hypothetical protein
MQVSKMPRSVSPQPKPLCSFALLLALWLICAPLKSCTAQPATIQGQEIRAAQAQVLQAQEQHWKKVEVTVEAPVAKLLRDDTEGIPHQRFLLQLANGTTVLIAHDTAMAPYVPLHPGDWVRIHGEYIWTDRGGVIHWTHHTDTPRHEGGWIQYNGQIYQ